jgi:hypothetical protein
MNAANENAGPALSVILAAPHGWASVRRTVEHLEAQSALERVELVLVLPPGVEEPDPREIAAFRWFRLTRAPHGSIGHANAAGVISATAPVVVLSEDHCFPEPDWAAALLSAHEEGWAAVGPCVRNANPATAVSWADFFIGYGPWMLPAPRAEAEFLPGHNSSYKRDALLHYGERLGDMLEAETLLHWDLRQRGRRLLLEPSAVAAHTNFSLWRSWLPVQFYAGRLFGGSRAHGMPVWKRGVYIFGSPLIQLVRGARIARFALRSRQLARFCVTLPTLGLGLVLDGIGQFAGYVGGVGDAREKVARYEYRRLDHITEHDRRLLFEDASPPRR